MASAVSERISYWVTMNITHPPYCTRRSLVAKVSGQSGALSDDDSQFATAIHIVNGMPQKEADDRN